MKPQVICLMVSSVDGRTLNSRQRPKRSGGELFERIHDELGGDPIVVVLTEQVSDAHLAGLRSENVSYIFAGKSELDLALALDILNRELGVKRLLLEGGGGANGAFLRAGLIDELNLVIVPAVDGAKGAPSVFESSEAESDRRAPVTAMTLESSKALDGGAMLLRYRIQNA